MRNDLLSVLGGLFSADLLSVGRKGSIVSRNVRVDSESYDYQVYVPPNIEKIKDLPVIVFLHGIRERGSGGLIAAEGTLNAILKQYLKKIPAVVLFPQCRPGKYWSDPAMEQMVIKAVERTTEEYNADEKRLYLMGVSMGGYGVWHFAPRYPEKFAALVAICGGSPIIKGDRYNPIAEKIGKTPAWLFHGAQDTIVPVAESRSLVKAIEENQGNVKYTEYENVGHNVWLNVLGEKELLLWLFQQKSN
jgi:predicted peptidase